MTPAESQGTASREADVEVVIVTMAFAATDLEKLHAVLARYVVLTRGHAGCRNIDYCVSASSPDRIVVIQKWESVAAQEAHFSSDEMVQMAQSCRGILSHAPVIELLEGISAHDLA